MIDGEYSVSGWNRYMYCAGNPVLYKDPSGHTVADNRNWLQKAVDTISADEKGAINLEVSNNPVKMFVQAVGNFLAGRGFNKNNWDIAKEYAEYGYKVNVKFIDGSIKNQDWIDNRYSSKLKNINYNSETGVRLPYSKDHWKNEDVRKSSRFGWRTHPISGDQQFHTGLDVSTGGEEIPLHTVAAGTVVSAKVEGGYGKRVVVHHGNGVESSYAHMSSFSVKRGDKLRAGELIGNTGTTGGSTGEHVHYEVRVYGEAKNPETYKDW